MPMREWPTKEEFKPEHVYVMTTTCPRKKHVDACPRTREIRLDGAGLYKYRQGALLQEAFPKLTPGEREGLQTGMSDECWDDMFKDMDEE